MQTNLARYLLWQFRDFARDRALSLLIVGILIGLTIVGPVRGLGMLGNNSVMMTILATVVTQVSYIASFITLNGIISTDRKQGYYRFLFSKPVSIPAYYAQLLIVYFVGYMLVCAMLLGLFSIFAAPISLWRPLAFCGLVFLSVAGIAFLVSSLFRHDWPILAGILLGSAILQGWWGGSEGWKRMVLAILPPVNRLRDSLPTILTEGRVDANSLIWLLGYSAIWFAAGMLILRRRPFD